MNNWIEKQFRLKENHTNVKTELIAGFATFVTMAYVLATIPNILGGAGFNKSSILIVMIVLIMISTIAMALYTNRPFALAPGLGSVSIVAGMAANEGIPIDIVAGIIFLSGVLFILVSFLGLREAVVRVIPKSLKFAISAGIGLFIALIGAKTCGLVVANEARRALGFGDLTSPKVILAVIGFVIILILKTKKVPGYIILSILFTTIIGIPMGITTIPTTFFALPGGVGDSLINIDIIGALKFAYIPFLIALFVPDFFSTFGTVIGVGGKAGYLDEEGNLPGIDKCFKVDAIATAVGGLFCIPCMTTYLESSVGVESGGRTGLTTITTSILFGLTLFMAPIALMIPSAATAPALIYIGIGMLGAMKNIDYSDETEYFPAFLCVVFTIFANNIANGICIALPTYLLLKLVSGKRKEISPVLYVLVAVCVLYFYSILG
jgi:AGZA family xanthine/uracil permease-like MFS transporter